MHGGIYKNDLKMNPCSCGNMPDAIWYYISGTANRIHYFVKCNVCKNRTRNRKNVEGAVCDWNSEKVLTQYDTEKQ